MNPDLIFLLHGLGVEVRRLRLSAGGCEALLYGADGRELPDVGHHEGDPMGGSTQAPSDERLSRMAKDYADCVASGRSCVVVNRTHRENDAIAAKIREELKSRGLLGSGETIQTVRSLGWTAAQKRDFRRYEPGHIVELTTGRDQGQCYEVLGVERGRGLRTRDKENGAERFFTRAETSRFEVCELRPLEIAPGDLILLRSGQKSPELINGERLLITRVQNGELHGRRIGPDNLPAGADKPIGLRDFTYAYASTSYRAQGMTVDVALVGLDRESLAHADAKTLYVSGTRPREELRFYVENKEALLAQAGRISGDRKAALELVHPASLKSPNSQALAHKRLSLPPSLRAAAHRVALMVAHVGQFPAIRAVQERFAPARTQAQAPDLHSQAVQQKNQIRIHL